MAKAPVRERPRLSFRIGSEQASSDSFDQNFSDKLESAIIGQIITRVPAVRVVDRDKLESRLKRVIEQEYRRGIMYGVNNMFGRISPNELRAGEVMHTNRPIVFGSLGDNSTANNLDMDLFPDRKGPSLRRPTGRLEWKPLSRHTVKRKFAARGKDASAFREARKIYEDTGRLKRWISRYALAIVRKTGVVKVRLNVKQERVRGRFVKQKKVPLGNLLITLMPSVPKGLLPGLASGNFGQVDPNMGFESRVISNSDVMKKLRGSERRPDTHRPFLQPIFTYWTQYYVPARIALQIRKFL